MVQQKRCSCSSPYLLLFKGGMRSPFWLHSMPCDAPSWSLFFLSLIFTPALWWDVKCFTQSINHFHACGFVLVGLKIIVATAARRLALVADTICSCLCNIVFVDIWWWWWGYYLNIDIGQLLFSQKRCCQIKVLSREKLECLILKSTWLRPVIVTNCMW